MSIAGSDYVQVPQRLNYRFPNSKFGSSPNDGAVDQHSQYLQVYSPLPLNSRYIVTKNLSQKFNWLKTVTHTNLKVILCKLQNRTSAWSFFSFAPLQQIGPRRPRFCGELSLIGTSALLAAIVLGRLEPFEVTEGKWGTAGLVFNADILLRLELAVESIFGKLPTEFKGTWPWPGRVKYKVV